MTILTSDKWFYCCPFEDCLFFYCDNTSYKCDFNGVILESKPNYIVKIPNTTSGYTESFKNPQFFSTAAADVNGTRIYFGTVEDQLVSFNRFDVKVVLTITNFTHDKQFNKVVVVDNRVYISNGSTLFEVLLTAKESVRQTKFVATFPTQNLRIYNISGLLVARDALEGKLYVETAFEQFIEQDIDISDFNMKLVTEHAIVGVQNDMFCTISFENGLLVISEFMQYDGFELELGKNGIQMTQSATKKLYNVINPKQVSDMYYRKFVQLQNLIQPTGYSKLVPLQLLHDIENKVIINGPKPWMIPLLIHHSNLDKYYARETIMRISNATILQVIFLVDFGFTVSEIKQMMKNGIKIDATQFLLDVARSNPNNANFLSQIVIIPQQVMDYELASEAISDTCITEQSVSKIVFLHQNNLPFLQNISLVQAFKFTAKYENPCALGRIEQFKLLIKPNQIESADSPLLAAINAQNLPAIKALIEYQLLSNYKETELSLMSCSMLSENADLFKNQLRMRNADSTTALMRMASVPNQYRDPEWLGAELYMRDKHGNTALVYAILAVNWRFIQFLTKEIGFPAAQSPFLTALTNKAPESVIKKMYFVYEKQVFAQCSKHKQYEKQISKYLDRRCMMTGRTLGDLFENSFDSGYFGGVFQHNLRHLANEQWNCTLAAEESQNFDWMGRDFEF